MRRNLPSYTKDEVQVPTGISNSDTKMTLRMSVKNEEGQRVITQDTLLGEDAEFLPHVLSRMTKFLAEAGFDIALDVLDDQSFRIGPALHKILTGPLAEIEHEPSI